MHVQGVGRLHEPDSGGVHLRTSWSGCRRSFSAFVGRAGRRRQRCGGGQAETARPSRRTLAAQQRRFDWFRQRYNAERRHEALGQRLPASLYQASLRPYPAALLPITYPGHYEVGRVSRNGGIRWGSRWVNVSHVLAELDVGFE